MRVKYEIWLFRDLALDLLLFCLIRGDRQYRISPYFVTATDADEWYSTFGYNELTDEYLNNVR